MLNINDIDFSEAFWDCWSGTGSVVADCNCGKTHVAMNSIDLGWYSSPDENDDHATAVAYFEEMAKNNPNMILDYGDFDTFTILELAGRGFVYGCECEGWKPYMNFIINSRYDIKEFLIKIHEEIKRAEEHYRTFEVLKEI